MVGRIWIDVTDFLKWRGALTGFQHIQYNIAREYIAAGRPVCFFVYDEPARTFRAVDFNPDEVAKDGVIGSLQTQPQTVAASKVKGAVKRYAPKSVKRVGRKLLSMRARTATVVTKSTAASPFEPGDVVVVLGGIWHGTFAEDMVLAKKQKKFKFVHIVHDMIPVVRPQYVVEDLPGVFSTYKNTVFRIADGLIVNSESSKRDAVVFMKERGIDVPPSAVFRLADEPPVIKESPIPKLAGKDFILSMGTVEGRKNHALLYYVYKRAKHLGIDLPTLVIAGRIGWLVGDIKYIIERDPDVKDKIIFLSDVPNSQRAWLFKNCLFTVWPSFYEGWGMPVAESLAYGKLCISSDTSSMKEVGGDLCVYQDPNSPDAWLELISMYTKASARKPLEAKIQKQYRVTTWHDMYKTISTFVDEIGGWHSES